MPRINALLTQAMANLRTCLEMTERVEPRDRWSAIYLPLTNLLGKELTKCLRRTGELRHDYRYIGVLYDSDGRRTDDHVVPLKCIIERLIGCAGEWPRGPEGIAHLREFLGEHLVMANIPTGLNKRLKRESMPNDDWWKPVGSTFGDMKKQMALWGRYMNPELGLIMPWSAAPHFVPTKVRA